MKKIFTLLLCYIFSVFLLSAQPEPCVDPAMTPLCEDACVICDIDGFSGRNFPQQGGIAPDGFCTTLVHNISWIAFIAGTPNLTLDVRVSNCTINWGLEIGIYESLDCETTRLVSNCNTDASPGVHRFQNTEPLVVGQYYYFVMDGSNDDVCNYEVTVVDGSTNVNALEPISEIEGPIEACPGTITNYSVPARFGANFQQWSINGGVVLTQDTLLAHEFDTPGTYRICYSAYNVCDTIPPVCKNVIIKPLPPVLYEDSLCLNECIYVNELDTTICEPGLTILTEDLPNGCTQTYEVNLFHKPTPSSDLELEFCFGDSVRIGDQYFFESGTYQPRLTSRDGCDSIVNLTVSTFLCDINGGFADDSLSCAGDTNGILRFSLLDGKYPYQYDWEEKTITGLTGSGTSNSPGDIVEIGGLPAGIYSVTVTDADNSRGVFIGQVFEPTPIIADITGSDFNGYGTTCTEAEDGFISIVPEGGSPGYSYQWNDSSIDTGQRENLVAGTYSVSITDTKGCEEVFITEIIAPSPILSSFQITEPGCQPDDSGIISIENIEGGAGDYQIAFAGGDFGNQNSFGNLLPGEYELIIRDGNGCIIRLDTTLAEPNQLTLDLGADLEIFLGDSVQLIAQTNENNLTYQWSGGTAISCPDCPRTFVRPIENSTYTLVATMSNRCFQTDSIFVKIIDRRRVYVPSAFSPNDDGINDFLPIFGGAEVVQVVDFQVFGRWGELIYKNENFAPNNPEVGWDGKFRGDELDPGVYVWIANVEFIDGRTEIYEGDITLFR